ncbi:MAG: radical SAM protein [Candidatus Aenigmatarchaeota archaeon]
MLFNWLRYIYCKNSDRHHVRSITLEVTTKCNNRCLMCDIWKSKDKNDMKLEDIEKFFKNSKLRDVRSFAFMGGETYLYTHLVEATRLLKKYVPHTRLFTSSNCYATDIVVKKAVVMNEIMPLYFCASLDGLEKTHNHIRGVKDSYKHVMKTIKLLKENGIDPFVSFTLVPENYKQLEEVYKKVRKMGIKSMSSRPASCGVYFDNLDKKFTFTDKQKAEMLKEMKRIDYGGHFLLYGSAEFLQGRRVLPCGAGYFSCFITKNFDVYPCTHCPKDWNMGNLRNFNFNLEKLLDSKKAKKIRRKVDVCNSCINDMEFCATYSMQQFKVASWLLSRKPLSWFFKQLFKK